jgi:DNA polymerase III epsilon subunit family exonuclease
MSPPGANLSAPVTFSPSPAQLRAIEAQPGPTLVLAGPGAGKTFCLIARIEHLIGRLGFEPRRICAVTFTTKAADEIAERLRAALGPAAEEITRGTLHALCLSILREYPAAVGLRRGFGVADEDYQTRLLRRLRVRRERIGSLLTLFGRHRLQHIPLTPGDLELFRTYREALRSRNLVDYDDLIGLAGELLRCTPEAGAELRSRWDCVLVDEFQDLSLAQYEVVTGLTAQHRHCFVVGDDEQSIFSWAGADAHILDRFRTDFDISDPIVLDRNRRCSRQIFEVARRLIGRNPVLFDKHLEADRESEHCVEAYAFDDDQEEASWLLADLLRDQAATRLDWGDYALLYRTHRVGQLLETRLIEAGVPCRLARGQALRDDEVIGYVAAALRVIRAPEDPLAIEALAELLLPGHLLEQLKVRYHELDLLAGLRTYARSAPGEADAKKAWRFIYQVGNLEALRRTHETLRPLVEELLSQRIGPYRNPLEERAAELSDPKDFPGAWPMATRLYETVSRGGMIWVEPDRGLEIAFVRMLKAALGDYVQRLAPGRRPARGDFVVRAGSVRPLALFKALQLHHCRALADPFQDYVAFDLETTDVDAAECGIVEIAAVRVRGRVIVEQFQRLVQPGRPVSAKASEVHGYYDRDLCHQPAFDRIWPEFREFVGSDLLVAHNGRRFDVPVLLRLAAGLPGSDDLIFFDTLPLARSLMEESAKLEDLAHRFGVSAGRSHHALDDASALAGVLRHLGELRLAQARKAALVNLLGWLGIALVLDEGADATPEERLLRDLAIPAVLGRFGDCLQVYADECEAADAPSVEELTERLGGARLMERIRAQRPAAERYPASVARLQALLASSAGETLADSIDQLLGRVALSRSGGSPVEDRRVNLLTLHSTKGLEFSRVYVVGAEDATLPGQLALENQNLREIQEARRLLYVGMTRARDRLILTRAGLRDGRGTGGSLFLREAGLEPVPVG